MYLVKCTLGKDTELRSELARIALGAQIALKDRFVTEQN